VLRLSGAHLLDEADRLLPPGCPRPRGRREALAGLCTWMPGGEVEVDLLVFPGPASSTGEDVLELHVPGSLPVVAAVVDGLVARGARHAEAGEFTRRAFLNGRLDLTQAEAVLALVSARDAGDAQAAASLLAGALGAAMQQTRDALTAALTELEAGLDFEEGDSQDLAPGEIDGLLDQAECSLRGGLEEEERTLERRDTTPRIGLLGPPNAGKTALVVALTGDDGLVSAQAGTTRDWRETPWPDAGDEVVLLDGPGLGAGAADARDAAARVQATANLPRVDLWWRCEDPAQPDPQLVQPTPAPLLQVWTKADLGGAVPEAGRGAVEAVRVSARDGQGLAELRARTVALLDDDAERRGAVRAGSERHRAALEEALEALVRARNLHAADGPQDLLAEELRAALQALAGLVGRFTPEDLLDRVFASFCVGK
jgi:tRNA modification GTPase